MKYILLLTFSLVLSAFPAAAQERPAQSQDAAKESGAEKVPEKKPEMKRPKTTKDLDAFFKEGERQAKDGPRCDTPPTPVA